MDHRNRKEEARTLARACGGHSLGAHADAGLQQPACLCLLTQLLLGHEGLPIAAVLHDTPFADSRTCCDLSCSSLA